MGKLIRGKAEKLSVCGEGSVTQRERSKDGNRKKTVGNTSAIFLSL